MSLVMFDHEVQGLAHPLSIIAEWDAGDRSVGINPGWWLVEARAEMLTVSAGGAAKLYQPLFTINRDEFEWLFGSEALRVVEDAADDHARARMDENADLQYAAAKEEVGA